MIAFSFKSIVQNFVLKFTLLPQFLRKQF